MSDGLVETMHRRDHDTRQPLPDLTRRTVLASVAACAATLPFVAVQAAAVDPGDLRRNAQPIRSIDPSDEDYRDLEPLADAIGDARVVQLGEPSHGGGAAFAAKARLVKFLHQRLGFDVLVWESGLYDVALAQAGMRGADDALTAARRGIFTLWTEAAEVKPLFEYIKASQASLRPIEMAGFDMQITADGSAERYAADLRTFAAGLRVPALREQALALAISATGARSRLLSSGFADRRDLDALIMAVEELRAMIHAHGTVFETAWSALHMAFMDRTIENMRADAVQRFEAAGSPKTTTARESRRDALNAANLEWLIEQPYAGRKTIVWAHNAHVMNAYYAPNFRDIHLTHGPDDMSPMGVLLAARLGHQLYTIGITAFDGREGFAVGGPTTLIPAAPADSLEAHLHALGHPFLFLDLRHGGRLPPSVRTVRIPKFDSVGISNPARVYDGLIFIDAMTPATHLI